MFSSHLFGFLYCRFADLVGFTAWSSVREPSQVFQLLEIIYHSFDMIAKRRRVFKVETVGDCYGRSQLSKTLLFNIGSFGNALTNTCFSSSFFCISVLDSVVAVSGLPEPRKDHAVVIAKFAHDCIVRMNRLAKALEKSLG